MVLLRKLDEARMQLDQFLTQGTIESFCAGSCTFADMSECTTDLDCAAMALDPGVLEGECVQRRCFDSTNLENAIIDATSGTDTRESSPRKPEKVRRSGDT